MKLRGFGWIICLSLVIIFLSSCKHRQYPNFANEALIDEYVRQGRDSFQTNIGYSRKILQKALKLAKDSMRYYEVYEVYASTYFLINQFDSGFAAKEKIVQYLSKQPNSKRKYDILTSIHNSVGIYYGRLGKFQQGLDYLKKALAYCQEDSLKPHIYVNLADIYKSTGDYTNAILCMKEALTVIDRHNMKDMKFSVYFALGDIYLDLRDFEKSNYYYSLSEKDYPNRTKAEQTVFCNNRGNYYYYAKNYSKALVWMLREVEMAKATQDVYMLNFGYVNLADICLNLNKLDLSYYYLNKAKPFFESIQFNTALCYLNTIQIGLYVKQGKYAQALQLEKECKGIKDVDPNILLIRDKYLEELSIKMNNYKNAYHYLNENMLINDSIRNELTKKRISEISMRYKQDTALIKKELLIQKQKAEVKSLQSSTYIWTLICILIFTVAVFIYFYITRRHKLQRMKYIDQMTTFRISNIRNRISPHFMFNVLNNEMQDIEEEKKNHFYILIHLLRKSLELTEQTSIKLSDEINFVQSFVELQKYRVGENFKMTWDIDPKINIEKVFIIPMMLQIPVENSIKHGLSQKKEGDKLLNIVIKDEADGITIQITDNGIGLHPERTNNTKGTGTGLKVLNQTMQILNSKNVNKITFEMKNIEAPDRTGAETSIFIPHQYKFEYK